jgi:two-component system sensor histidine kinase UhpB
METTAPCAPSFSLRIRVSLVLTALAAVLLNFAAIGWLVETREAIREETQAASRVAEQWLAVVTREARTSDAADARERLLRELHEVGRIRANEVELRDAADRLLYRSPPPRYKAGRDAPEWFAIWLTPDLPTKRFDLGDLTLAMKPDASRSVLDAWDRLGTLAAWVLAGLASLFLSCWLALADALHPLGEIMEALDRLGHGRFDTRLPVFGSRELGRLAHAFNEMADRLDAAVVENVRLAHESELAATVQARLEEDRRAIARELHDELAQGITAVCALAGAIEQRSSNRPEVSRSARAIVNTTGDMHAAVRTILRRLRRPEHAEEGLAGILHNWLVAWREQHPAIVLDTCIAPGPDPLADAQAFAVLRIVQESLTNVARHADAHHARLTLRRDGEWIEIEVADNGRGLVPAAGCDGLGLVGMRERAAELGGALAIRSPRTGGTVVSARLPLVPSEPAAS